MSGGEERHIVNNGTKNALILLTKKLKTGQAAQKKSRLKIYHRMKNK